jgi:hypothetical protein
MCFRLTFCLFLLLTKIASAQSSLLSALPGYLDITAYSNRFEDAFSARLNPALLAGHKIFAAGLYSEQKYLLPELTSFHSAIILPVVYGAFMGAVEYAGSGYHHATSFDLGYGRTLGKLDVGAGFRYFRESFSNYQEISAISLQLACTGSIGNNIRFGFSGQHLFSAQTENAIRERWPFYLTAGLGWDASSQLHLKTEIVKPEEEPVDLSVAFHYQPDTRLVFRMGFRSTGPCFFGGAGFLIKSLRFDVTVSSHPYLGISPGLMLTYKAGKK